MVYALRMQLERMSDAFIPSLREYAERYQINAGRLGPGQLLMHPGPVNRGVELSADAIDSPQALIAEQVKAGVAVRMAVLYEVLVGAPILAGGGVVCPSRLSACSAPAAAGRAAHPRRLRARSPDRSGRAPRRPRPWRPHRQLGAPAPCPSRRRAQTIEGAGNTCSPASSTPMSTCAPPARSTRRTCHRHRRSRRGRLVAVIAMPNTDPVIDQRGGAALARRRRPARTPACRSASWPRSPTACAGMSSPRWPSSATPARSASPTTAGRRLGRLLRGAAVPAAVRRRDRPARGGPGAVGDGVMHEGDVGTPRAGRNPSVSESTMIARDAALAHYEDARVHFQHLVCARIGRGAGRGQGGRRRGERRGHAAPSDAHRRGRAHARQPFQDEPAAAHRVRSRGPDRGAADGVIDCVATDHAPHGRAEKEVPFEQAPVGTTGLETPSPRSTPSSCCRGSSSSTARRAPDRRRWAV